MIIDENNISDIINNLRNKDKKTEEKFYKFYKKRIFQFLKNKYPNNNEIDDDTSEILFKILKNIKTYKVEKSKFNTWVINIANNYMIDKSRRNKIVYGTFVSPNNVNNNDLNLIDEPKSHYNEPDYFLEMKDSVNYINKLIKNDDISLIHMKYLGYKYKEIGLKFNLTEKQVSNKINYIINKISKKRNESI